MARWLKNELSEYLDDLAVLMVAKTDDSGIGSNNPVDPEDLDRWQAQKQLNCPHCLFLDGDRYTEGFAVWDKFVDANPYRYTAGIPMVLNKKMEIVSISGTYEWSQYDWDAIINCLQGN